MTAFSGVFVQPTGIDMAGGRKWPVRYTTCRAQSYSRNHILDPPDSVRELMKRSDLKAANDFASVSRPSAYFCSVCRNRWTIKTPGQLQRQGCRLTVSFAVRANCRACSKRSSLCSSSPTCCSSQAAFAFATLVSHYHARVQVIGPHLSVEGRSQRSQGTVGYPWYRQIETG
jgi:hypothetical protein